MLFSFEILGESNCKWKKLFQEGAFKLHWQSVVKGQENGLTALNRKEV